MTLAPGKLLSPYRLVDKLGEGGMGEAWRAEDTSLGRGVAIKVLPGAFAADPDRLARFEREARLLAALDHPNVAAVYGLHEQGGVRFIAMELVAGVDLAQRLEAAHEQGVIHRDLKPANVCVAPDGKVKVLDFGLAKAMAAEAGGSSNAGLSISPTLTAGTVAGVVLGTAAYMSPEQARGKPVDRRTDIWAFGVLLYETLTGRRLFSGETVSDVLAAVLRAEVRLEGLPGATPPAIRHMLRRCLDRDPGRRLRDIGEARIVLETPDAAAPAELSASPAPALPLSRLRLAALLAAAIVIGALAGWRLGPAPPAPATATMRLTLAPPAGVTGPRLMPRLCPDGRAMAYLADGKLWIQPLDRLTPRPVVGSEGATTFTWSPDGRSLAFGVGSRLWRTEVGGDPVRVSELPSVIPSTGGLVWADAHRLYFSTGDNSIFEVPVSGGTPQVFLAPDPATESDFHNPAALPDGKGLIFLTHRKLKGTDTLEALSGDRRRFLFQEEHASLSEPFYDAAGQRILFSRSDSNPGLWALPFSLSSLTATGPPVLISSQGSSPSTAADGSLLYANKAQGGDHRIVLVGLDGAVRQTVGRPMLHIDNLTYSPDGRQLAACIDQGSSTGLWLFDLERGTETRLVQDANCSGAMGGVSWTPDAAALAFGDTSRREMRQHRTDGAVEETNLGSGLVPDISADGRWLALVRDSPETGTDIWFQPADGSSPAKPLQATSAAQSLPRISPGGDLLAFLLDDSGTPGVFLRPFPSGDGLWQVSAGGGDMPRWSADGSRLYYLEDDSRLMEVLVQAGPAPHPRPAS